MAGDTIITIVGNLTADPEMRFTPSGAAVASFTVASTPRTFDRQAGEWKDGETLFMPCQAWRQMVENIAEAIESYVEAARTDADMPLDALEYTLDIARYVLAQVTRS